MTACLLLGQVLLFSGDPQRKGPDAAHVETAGAVLVSGGLIQATGPADVLRQAHPEAKILDHSPHLILPGFVDCHIHYAQTGIIASWGKRLIDWLNTYTFPEEARFSDIEVARAAADKTLDLKLAHGTTTAASFCTSSANSVDAFFEAAAARNMAVVAGYTAMNRNVPPQLEDSEQEAYEVSDVLARAWHGKGRARYAFTPRFAPTSTWMQLNLLGELWSDHPDCLMQTHLSEQTDEVAWVRELYPDAKDYLDVYESAGLLRERSVFGHAIHMEAREIDRLAEVGAGLAHCPTSNTFIGSGLFDCAGLNWRGIPIGLATDTGGGSSFSMLRTMAAAYEIGQLRGAPLHPAALLYLATEGSARVLHMAEEVGTMATGSAADLVVLDLGSTPEIAQRAARARDIWEAIFPTIMMGDDRAIAATYVAGEAVAP